MSKVIKLLAGVIVLSLVAGTAMAKVSADEAKKLKGELTPFGAIKAGNADGSIPAWEPMTTPPAGYKAGGPRINPYASEKPILTITSANYKQYADKLTEGQKALFELNPDSYKMLVYPTHRNHAMPEWIYETTYQNATTGELVDDGNGVVSIVAGLPFPIPHDGSEVMWNSLARYQGEYRKAHGLQTTIVESNGLESLDITRNDDTVYTFYEGGKAGAADALKRKGLFSFASTEVAPAANAGFGILVIESLNAKKNPRQAWIYSPGERRVRRAPTLGFDTPDRSINTYDDYELFSGSPERYDFKLVGKKEVYIPYNSYKMNEPGIKKEDFLTPKHHNPDYVRWELHRVWEVEATVKSNARHIYAKRVFFVDEDSWAIAATDKYDGKGKLWRTGFSFLKNFYDIPMTNYTAYTHFDLKTGGYFTDNYSEKTPIYEYDAKKPKNAYYTASGLRRRGRR